MNRIRINVRLLSQLQSGDPNALGDLLESCRPYVRVVLHGVLMRKGATGINEESDLVQESLLQASIAAHSFRGQSLEEWLGWVRQISLRTSYRFLEADDRHMSGHRALLGAELGLASPAASPSECAILGETAARMAIALGRLPKEMQIVLLARVVENLDHAEIATQLGRTTGAVRMLYLRALKRLREVWLSEFSSGSRSPV